MAEFFGSVWWLIVTLAILVTFHEFGHFWVARKLGVKVLRFSVGFGRPLLRKVGRDGTEYVVAGIPLGGYVKMLDEREGHVPPEELPQAFNRQAVWKRILIVVAGPVFNLVFALAAFWLMLVVGIPEPRAVFSAPQGIAASSGMHGTQDILAVGDESVVTMHHAMTALLPYALDREPVTLTLRNTDGSQAEVTLALDELGDDFSEQRIFSDLGLEPWNIAMELPPLITGLSEGGPAQLAGIEAGDRLLSISGRATGHWQDVVNIITAEAKADQPLPVEILRDGQTLTVNVVPTYLEANGNRAIRLGITGPTPDQSQVDGFLERARIILKTAPLAAVPGAFSETWRTTKFTLSFLARIVTGKASIRSLSSPVGIAQAANASANVGFSRYIWFLAIISLSLAILNFLPIPVLDGGHLLYYLIEWVKGSPLSEKAQIAGQYAGLALLASVFSIVFVNDILRLFG